MSRSALPALAALILICVSGRVARGADWPQFRGPNRDGVWSEPGEIVDFPAEGLPAVWRAPAGWGWSSPVIARGRLYVTDSILEKPKAWERVRCLAAGSGQPLWEKRYEVTYPLWAFDGEQVTGPNSTPVIEGASLYVLGASGELHCFDAMTGAVRWERHAGTEYEMPENAGTVSPLLEGGLLILEIGGKNGACVVALHKETGVEAWRSMDEPMAYAAPIVLTAAGRRQLIIWTQRGVNGLDVTDGKVLWHEPMSTSQNDANATPVTAGDLLLVSGAMFRLNESDPLATLLWPESPVLAKRILSNTSSPVLQGDYLYSARSKGQLVCLETKTGHEVWSTDQVTPLRNLGASIHITMHGADAILCTDEGKVIRARLAPDGYHEIARSELVHGKYKFGGHLLCWALPAFADGCIFLRGGDELVCARMLKPGETR
jgi:outer membrane protein assembly factor BamB